MTEQTSLWNRKPNKWALKSKWLACLTVRSRMRLVVEILIDHKKLNKYRNTTGRIYILESEICTWGRREEYSLNCLCECMVMAYWGYKGYNIRIWWHGVLINISENKPKFFFVLPNPKLIVPLCRQNTFYHFSCSETCFNWDIRLT